MRYCKRIDVTRAMDQTLAAMQPGQHVSAHGDTHGVWAGQTRIGVMVVMWEGNARGRNRADYFRRLRDYAQANA